MVKIDDAGWGCLVGGVLLGIYREETSQFSYTEIPVEMFQGQAFACRQYHEAAYRLTPELLRSIDVSPEEPITVCTGEVLAGVRRYLADNGYNWHRGKITGGLQEKIETALMQKLNGLGIRVDYKTLTEKQGLLFWHCVRWLKGGNLNAKALPERERLCKTGWKTFRAWADLPYNQAKEEAKRVRRRRSRWESTQAEIAA